MEGLAAVAFVLAAGLTFCGLSGTAIETIAGRRLSLREPFVCSNNVCRSLVLVLLAGPFMALNEAVAAVRDKRIDETLFVCIAGFCVFWLAAVGVFVLGLVESLRDPLVWPHCAQGF
jgi:hypothetical protein